MVATRLLVEVVFKRMNQQVTGGKDSENCLREFWRERGNQQVIGGQGRKRRVFQERAEQRRQKKVRSCRESERGERSVLREMVS